MELPSQIAAGIAVVIGVSALAHFFYIALSRPANMDLGLAQSEFPATLGGRVYLGLVALSGMAFTFIGAHAVLRWLPGDLPILVAIVVAFLSLGLLRHLERSAYIRHAYQRELRVREELDKLIAYATIMSEGTVENFREKSKSAELRVDREAYAELVEVAQSLAKRDTALWNSAMRQAEDVRQKDALVAQQSADALDAANAAAKAHATKQDRRARLHQVLCAESPTLPVSKVLDLVSGGMETLLEPSVAKMKWQVLCDFAAKLRIQGAGAELPGLLNAVPGVHPLERAIFEVHRNGSQRDGHFDVVSNCDGIPGQLADGLAFEDSLDGLVAAFFIRAALPRFLAWNHGLYDRDQEFVFTVDSAVAILENDRVSPDDENLRAIKTPPGLRFMREPDGALRMLCLAYRPGRGFYDYSVSILNNRAAILETSALYEWGGGVFY